MSSIKYNPSKPIIDYINEVLAERDLGITKDKSDVIRYIQFVIMKGLRLESEKGQERFFREKGVKIEKDEKKEINLSPFEHWKSKTRHLELLEKTDFLSLNSSDKSTIKNLANSIFSAGVAYQKTWIFGIHSNIQLESVGSQIQPPHKNNFVPLCYFLYYESCDRDENGKILISTGDSNFKAKWLSWRGNHKEFKNGTDSKGEVRTADPYIPEKAYSRAKARAIKRKFLKAFKGNYLIFFIEDGSSHEVSIKYGASVLTVGDSSSYFYYKMHTTNNLVRVEMDISRHDNDQAFLIYQNDKQWGYNATFKKPLYDKVEDFSFFYIGFREIDIKKDFTGYAMAIKVYDKGDLILPNRMMDALDVNNLNACPDLVDYMKEYDIKTDEEKAKKIYQNKFDSCPPLSPVVSKRLPKVMTDLIEKGCPLV